MDPWYRELMNGHTEAISAILEAPELTVIYHHSPESAEIGVLDNGRFTAVRLKAILEAIYRDIDVEEIFGKWSGDGPFKGNPGKQKVADIFGVQVVFYQRYGGMECHELIVESKQVFTPQSVGAETPT